MKKKYLLFDIDGTLINADGAGKKALGMALEYHLRLPPEYLKDYSLAGKTDRGIIADIARMSGIHSRTIDTLAGKIADTYIDHLENRLKESENFCLYPNVKELLEKCAADRFLETALLTGNIQRGARLKLTHAGLWHFFEWGVYGDRHEDRNMLSKQALEHITNNNSAMVSPRDIFVIGDTVSDIRCGKAIDATTVAIVSDFQPENRLAAEHPDYLIHDFFELENILLQEHSSPAV